MPSSSTVTAGDWECYGLFVDKFHGAFICFTANEFSCPENVHGVRVARSRARASTTSAGKPYKVNKSHYSVFLCVMEPTEHCVNNNNDKWLGHFAPYFWVALTHKHSHKHINAIP